VLRVVEPVQHLLRHECPSFLDARDRAFDRGDLGVDALPLQSQQPDVDAQRLGVVLAGAQGGGDRRQPQPELPQQQDALQPGQRRLVVVARAVGTDAARR
jgi:hypothetical protein